MYKPALQVCLTLLTCVAMFTAQAYVVKKEDPLRPPEYRLTKPSTSTSTKKPQWHVNEILLSGERRVAIVNGIAVVVGDRVNGARVVDIQSGYVVLKYQGKVIKSQFKKLSVKNRKK